MAGKLVLSTLNDDTGVLATQNGMTGIAKAWVNFNGTGTVAIRSSFNVSSITDNGTGDYTVNFTTAMPNTNYCADATCEDFSLYNFMVAQAILRNTNSVQISTRQTNSSVADARSVYVAIFSS
jgi:hypothetical protein